MPNLIVIAGCNGAGKSTFSSSFLPEGLVSYDYDRIFLENYNSLINSELREKFARDETTKNFEDSIFHAIENKKDFCYETNFDFQPTFWAQKFKENEIYTNLVQIESTEVVLMTNELPDYFENRLPRIYKLINK